MLEPSLYESFKECLSAEYDYVHVEESASYYVKRRGRSLTLLFQKSNGAGDWLTNFDFLPQDGGSFRKGRAVLSCGLSVPKTPYRHMEPAQRWRCHRGFLRAIEPYVAEEIRDESVTDIRIVGYSHGAAVALLCYEYVRFHRPHVRVQGYGFGSPRVVWGKPPDAVLARFEGFTVIRNGRDLVTRLPPRFLGFRHVGDLVELDGDPRGGWIKDHTPEAYMAALRREKENRQNVLKSKPFCDTIQAKKL